MLISSNSRALSAILLLQNTFISGQSILTNYEDSYNQAILYFRRSIWTKELDLTLRSIADLLECSVTEYLYDKESGQIIVSFKR